MNMFCLCRLSREELLEYFALEKERGFVLADRATRKTGRMVKMISLIDQNHIAWSSIDLRFFKTLGASSKSTEKFYPQLLGRY